MLKLVGLLVIAFCAQALAKSRLTPLLIDNHPCKPEVLKNQVRYLCDSKGNVTCNHGWSNGNNSDPMNPCLTPVCSQGCKNGKCRRPDTCACHVGWEGNDCNTCVTLPGCVNGKCNNAALDCTCHNSTLWTGGLCDIPVCPDGCTNGHCIAPGVCKCNPGWTGVNCSDCVPLKGCSTLGGYCKNPNNPADQEPHACKCLPDYTGPLCDQPKCQPSCVSGHGECIFAYTNSTTPICKCNLGWKGSQCEKCIEYPGCPTTANCTEPYQCNCFGGETSNLCGIQSRKPW